MSVFQQIVIAFGAIAASSTAAFAAPVNGTGSTATGAVDTFNTTGGPVAITYTGERLLGLRNPREAQSGDRPVRSRWRQRRTARRVIRFNQPVSSITWTTLSTEYWHGFTVGTYGKAPPRAVPEPGAYALMAIGPIGVLAARRCG